MRMTRNLASEETLDALLDAEGRFSRWLVAAHAGLGASAPCRSRLE